MKEPLSNEKRPWWELPRKCQHCGRKFMPKLGGQFYCQEHRHLAGAVIKPK